MTSSLVEHRQAIIGAKSPLLASTADSPRNLVCQLIISDPDYENLRKTVSYNDDEKNKIKDISDVDVELEKLQQKRANLNNELLESYHTRLSELNANFKATQVPSAVWVPALNYYTDSVVVGVASTAVAGKIIVSLLIRTLNGSDVSIDIPAGYIVDPERPVNICPAGNINWQAGYPQMSQGNVAQHVQYFNQGGQ